MVAFRREQQQLVETWLRMAGDYVAFEEAECTLTCSADVAVVDLRRGTRLPAGIIDAWLIDGAIVLKPDGAVAFGYSTRTPPTAPPTFSIMARDRDGQRILDRGPRVDVRSLRLRGSVLTWRSGNATRSATLR